MASSAHEHHHHSLSNPYGTTAAPPPTPSNQTNLLYNSEAAAADALSCLLHRLPPTLNFSLRSRRSSDSTTTTTIPPLISLSENTSTLNSDILTAASSHGFFELTDHSISSDLALSAESDCISLFNLTHEEKSSRFPKNWPLGYDAGDDDDDDDDDVNETAGSESESFCFDSDCPAESNRSELSSLSDFTREMKKLGLEVMEVVFRALGFRDLTRGVCGLMWVSNQVGGSKNRPNMAGRMYPYVVGLQYQVRSEKHTMLTDAGWVNVSPRMGSVLVTLGDIAQVWCNGTLKKVRSRPLPVITDDTSNTANSITMTLLLTLPLESIVTPLLPKFFFGPFSLPKSLAVNHDQDDLEKRNSETHEEEDEKEKDKEERLFHTFSFEDYAWRIYHERLPSTKDPLVRYRV